MGVSNKEKPRSGGAFFSELARCSRDVRICDVVHGKRKEQELAASSADITSVERMLPRPVPQKPDPNRYVVFAMR